jgi:hypothetical protein
MGLGGFFSLNLCTFDQDNRLYVYIYTGDLNLLLLNVDDMAVHVL